jgi:hypothetical protein
MLEQHARAIVEILQQHFETAHAPCLAAFFPNFLFTPEFEPRLPPGFLLGHSRSHKLLYLLLEVEAQFVIHFFFYFVIHFFFYGVVAKK